VLPSSRISRIEELNAKIDQIAVDVSDFEEGVRQLRRLLPAIGYPGQIEWLRLSARIHQQMAWFLGHAGFSTSAFGEAKIAIDLCRVAYAEWQDKNDLRRLTETCLIASNSCLLVGDPESSRKYLQIAKEASEVISDPRGSEHYRQMGTAYFQLGEDALASDCFKKALEAMDAKNEAENDAHVLMTSKRQLALLGRGDWDESLEVLAAVRREYPAGSLQHVMMLNSAAASGLLTDSSSLEVAAMDMLTSNFPLARPYHHQLTRTALLSLTPSLPTEIRSTWIRRALYENAFKEL
jgi:tetratricopeptide (TPR) repeat protein